MKNQDCRLTTTYYLALAKFQVCDFLWELYCHLDTLIKPLKDNIKYNEKELKEIKKGMRKLSNAIIIG